MTHVHIRQIIYVVGGSRRVVALLAADMGTCRLILARVAAMVLPGCDRCARDGRQLLLRCFGSFILWLDK